MRKFFWSLTSLSQWKAELLVAFFCSCVCLRASAEVYLSQEQALDLVLGKECSRVHEPHEIGSHLLELLDDQGVEPEGSTTAHFFVCRQSGEATGYALIDSEVGKHLPITYIVGIDPRGNVSRVEIMVFREIRGWEVREASFTEQFSGKSEQDNLAIGKGLKNRSGATLSSIAIAKGVRRALTLWHHFYGGAK